MLALKDEYSDDTYEFEILGTYPYPASLRYLLSNSRFEELFDKEEGYFNGYFSNEELTDLDSKAVAATITYDDMTKVVRQLKDSMGQMFPLITVIFRIYGSPDFLSAVKNCGGKKCNGNFHAAYFRV